MRPIILCDLDGTLADCGHRQHLVLQAPKDWPKFFDLGEFDAPHMHVIHAVKALSKNYDIYITTGRPATYLSQTINWLEKYGIPFDRLIMRRADDKTDDDKLKPSWLTDGQIDRERVAFALDDRDRVVAAWRAAGIPCFQVAPGNF